LYGFNYLQYAKYEPGGKHEFHMDLPLDGKTVQYNLLEHLRKMTVILLLGEPGVDFEGGEFQINHFSEQYLFEYTECNWPLCFQRVEVDSGALNTSYFESHLVTLLTESLDLRNIRLSHPQTLSVTVSQVAQNLPLICIQGDLYHTLYLAQVPLLTVSFSTLG
jgi:hypothetical protein